MTAVRSSAADVVRLLIEKSTTPAHTVSLIILEGSEQISHERLHQLVGTSLPDLTRFRSRLVPRPLGVGPPFWAEIDDYDPTSQIHRATLRAPGGQREFADLISQLSAATRDHREMPWEAWSIDGLSGGRWALAVRTSPALSDSEAGAASIWSRLLRSDPHHDGSDDPQQPSPGMPAAVGELVTNLVSELLEYQFKGLWLVAETVNGLLRAVREQVGGFSVDSERNPVPPAVSSMSGPLPHNAFNAPLTDRRAVAFASIRQADLETVSNAFGGDVTNVLVAAATLSLRAWLQRHGTVPDDPLMIRMPFALPGAEVGDPPIGGHIRIPVQLGDPIEVLTNLHTATERMNTTHLLNSENADLTVDLARIVSLIPSTVVHAGMQIFSRLGLRQRLAPISHASVSYVSGRSLPAYCAGAQVVGMHTVTPLLEGCGLTVTLTARGEMMDLSVCVCPDNVPEVDEIATGIVDSLDILVAAAHESPRGQGRSVVTEMTSHTDKRRHARGY
ncbi:MAG: wax ester/triacylglycerol synthase domain-containing protein [Mycobacterium sp.]